MVTRLVGNSKATTLESNIMESNLMTLTPIISINSFPSPRAR
jgi:hypothetical protein